MGKKISYYDNFSKSKFLNLSLQERFELIYNENFWESEESRSGIGSEIENTKEVLKALEHFIKEFKIKSIIKFSLFNMLKISMKKNAVKGIDILSEPSVLIASAIVIAKQHVIIAKKDSKIISIFYYKYLDFNLYQYFMFNYNHILIFCILVILFTNYFLNYEINIILCYLKL